MDVGAWLRNLGLGKYEPAFIENAIDFDVLPELAEDDLEKLGMTLGDRKRFIRAIKAMPGGIPSQTAWSKLFRGFQPAIFCPIVALQLHAPHFMATPQIVG